MSTFEASACAKIILLGEHAVVYGQPAMAVPVSSLRARVYIEMAQPGDGVNFVFLNISGEGLSSAEVFFRRLTDLVVNWLKIPMPDCMVTINSEIPVASGLGSGTAVSVAYVRALYAALGCSLEQDVLNELVYEAETFHHGTPSGIDNTVIVYERPVYFVRGKPIERLVVSKPLFLLIADTGISASTRLSVADVRCLYDSDPLGTRSITSAIGDLVIQARGAIQCGDEGLLGELMVRNQELLRRLDVSSPGIDRLVKAASDAGGLGAKLSGGGRGGNVIVLVASDAAVRSHVCAALLSAGAVRVFETVVS